MGAYNTAIEQCIERSMQASSTLPGGRVGAHCSTRRTEKGIADMRGAINYGHGLSVVYSPVNVAYLVLWHGLVLRSFSKKADAVAYADDIAFKPDTSKCACEECQA